MKKERMKGSEENLGAEQRKEERVKASYGQRESRNLTWRRNLSPLLEIVGLGGLGLSIRRGGT